MDIIAARRLTELFNHRAQGRAIDYSELTITTNTARGMQVTVNVRKPFDAASYLKCFRDSEDPLLKRGVVPFIQGVVPTPIQFRIGGSYRDPETRQAWWAQLVRFRFSEKDKPSELCFDDDFCRTDWETPIARREGPSLNRMIDILYQSGNEWGQVQFLPSTPQQIRPKLTLVR